MHNNKLSTISLFSGALGLDLGLEKAGLDVTVCQELDPHACDTIRLNSPKRLKVLEGDLRQISTADILASAGLKRGQAFLVAGGPPCQSFSTAGRRESVADPRGGLFREFLRVVDEARPRFFLMENVKGLLSAAVKHRPINLRDGNLAPEEELGSAFEMIIKEFVRIGYSFSYQILDAVNYGSPQFRERLVVLGSRDNEPLFMPAPTHFQRHQDESLRWVTLRHAIKDLERHPGPGATFSDDRAKLLEYVPQGGNWRDLPERLRKDAMGAAYKAGGGKMGFYRRLSYDQPSPTLVTSPVQKATMLCHPTAPRPLSVKEYAAIQEFPDKWQFAGSLVDQYRQIGNAVPIKLGYSLGRTLQAIALGSFEIRTKRTRTQHTGQEVIVNTRTTRSDSQRRAGSILQAQAGLL
jgi:DNA (cytosine-5)-methyltransferase 1